MNDQEGYALLEEEQDCNCQFCRDFDAAETAAEYNWAVEQHFGPGCAICDSGHTAVVDISRAHDGSRKVLMALCTKCGKCVSSQGY